jgi:NAD+ diphosphatase
MLGCHGEALSTAITLDPDELEDALWLTRSEMLSVLAGLHPIIKPMRRGSIAHALVVNWLADRQN